MIFLCNYFGAFNGGNHPAIVKKVIKYVCSLFVLFFPKSVISTNILLYACLLTSKNIEIVLQFPHNWEFEKDVSAFQLKLY